MGEVYRLRPAFARAFTNAGLDRKTTMALAGRATESTFSRYRIVNPRGKVLGIRKLAGVADVEPRPAQARPARPRKRRA